jgi:bacterioferritin
MTADPRTLGWLQRALAHELGAVQQYLAQSVLARLWGEPALADTLRAEAQEELAHAEGLMRRLVELGRGPSAGAVAPARLGRNAAELWAANRQLEVEAVQLYEQALAHARRVRDAASAELLQGILQAEALHLSGIDQALSSAGRHG